MEIAEQQVVSIEDVRGAFRPSGALLQAGTTLAKALEIHAVANTTVNATTVDLLVRLSLSPDGELRGVDLCKQLLKSPGYVSRLIDQAEADGLVARGPDPKDRRAHLITLTGDGEDILEAFLPDAIAVLDQTVYAALDHDEIETLVTLLSRITQSAEAFLGSR